APGGGGARGLPAPPRMVGWTRARSHHSALCDSRRSGRVHAQARPRDQGHELLASRARGTARPARQHPALDGARSGPLLPALSVDWLVMTDADLDVFREEEEAPAAFPLTSGRERGYHRSAVDTFLEAARGAFEDDRDDFGADDVRAASFPLVKRGYRIADVDAALGRVEDAFAARARARAVREVGVD